jgi:DMSO reductase anchor subunit
MKNLFFLLVGCGVGYFIYPEMVKPLGLTTKVRKIFFISLFFIIVVGMLILNFVWDPA